MCARGSLDCNAKRGTQRVLKRTRFERQEKEVNTVTERQREREGGREMDTHTNTESGRCEGQMLMLIVRNQIKGERKQNKPKHRTTQQSKPIHSLHSMHAHGTHTHTHTSGSLARHSHFLLLLLLLLLLLVLLFPLLALVRETELG